MDLASVARVEPAPLPAAGHRARAFVVVTILAAVGVVGWVLWASGRPVERRCQLAPVVGAPAASDPTAALDAWWAAGGAGRVADASSSGYVAPAGAVPDRARLEPVDATHWEWRYLERSSIGVEVEPVAGRPGTWTVQGVGPCALGPPDLTGGA